MEEDDTATPKRISLSELMNGIPQRDQKIILELDVEENNTDIEEENVRAK